MGPGEGVRVGSAGVGWEVPCIARPARKRGRVVPGEVGGVLGSVCEEFVRLQALKDGGRWAVEGEGEEPGGGWVEDLNGLLGFNKRFRGRYVDIDHHDEE